MRGMSGDIEAEVVAVARADDGDCRKFLRCLNVTGLVSMAGLGLVIVYVTTRLMEENINNSGSFAAITITVGCLTTITGIVGAVVQHFAISWTPLVVCSAVMVILGSFTCGISCVSLLWSMDVHSPISSAVATQWDFWLHNPHCEGCDHPCPANIPACGELASMPVNCSSQDEPTPPCHSCEQPCRKILEDALFDELSNLPLASVVLAIVGVLYAVGQAYLELIGVEHCVEQIGANAKDPNEAMANFRAGGATGGSETADITLAISRWQCLMDTGGTIVVGVYSCVVATMALISSHYVMDYCAELMLSEASDTCSSWTTTGILLSSLGLFASAVMGIVLKKKAGGLYSTSSSATKLFLAVFGVSLTVAGFSSCLAAGYIQPLGQIIEDEWASIKPFVGSLSDRCVEDNTSEADEVYCRQVVLETTEGHMWLVFLTSTAATTLAYLVAWTSILTAGALQRQQMLEQLDGANTRRTGGVMLNQIKVSQPKKHRFRNPMTSSTGPGLPGRAASLSFDAETSARRTKHHRGGITTRNISKAPRAGRPNKLRDMKASLSGDGGNKTKNKIGAQSTRRAVDNRAWAK